MDDQLAEEEREEGRQAARAAVADDLATLDGVQALTIIHSWAES